MRTLIPFSRTIVLGAPSPPTTGVKLVIPKITLPSISPTAKPWPETSMAMVCPSREAPNQENAEMIEVTAATEIMVEGEKRWELTVVRAAEGTKARAIKAGDAFAFSVGATDLEPGPWVECKLGPKIQLTPEMKEVAPTQFPQMRWEPRNERIGMRGHIETGPLEVVKKSDVVIEIPEGFIFQGSSNYWLQPLIPVHLAGYNNGKSELEEIHKWQMLEMASPKPSLKYTSQVTITTAAPIDIMFTGVSFFPFR